MVPMFTGRLRIPLLLCIGVGTLLLAGCASVQPWQRGDLAKPKMAWNYCQLSLALDDHIYFSKEAMSGGRDFAGGGCGCN